jgi:4-alpha-glucanotransferase
MERSSGILLHPTSLPGAYGIGTLGREAKNFIDFLAGAHQRFWQILPLGPTGYADSPYQCFSAYAGNPFLIDLELLAEEGLLHKKDLETARVFRNGPVDYGRVISVKVPLLKKAYRAFLKKTDPKTLRAYRKFLHGAASWLPDFALFMALKEHFGLRPWYEWDTPFKMKEEKAIKPLRKQLAEQTGYQEFVQYLFFRQWETVREYAHSRNILIIGDIPLYVAHDSADAWAHPELFQFTRMKNPVAVGGVPPDYFSATGQLWGNPLYHWERMARKGYRWWIDRVKANLAMYDLIRIDHFRGLAAYWAVPYKETTAVNGSWKTCPGRAMLEAVRRELGQVPIIAEDLGVITPDVVALRQEFGLPGMKILQFAFDSGEENDFLPYNFTRDFVVYTGTHDNETVRGWFQNAKKADRKHLLEYADSDGKELNWDMIRLAWSSVADVAIVPMQDLLNLGNEARMNFPGTTTGNWQWRLKPGQMTHKISKRLEHLTQLYGRNK